MVTVQQQILMIGRHNDISSSFNGTTPASHNFRTQQRTLVVHNTGYNRIWGHNNGPLLSTTKATIDRSLWTPLSFLSTITTATSTQPMKEASSAEKEDGKAHVDRTNGTMHVFGYNYYCFLAEFRVDKIG